MDDVSDNGEFTKIGDVLKRKRHLNDSNVNTKRYNDDKKILTNVRNVKPEKDRLLEELLASYGDKPRGVAEIIAKNLNDSKHLNFHIKVAKKNNAHLLFEALSVTLEAQNQGNIRTTPAKYFVGVLKRKGIIW